MSVTSRIEALLDQLKGGGVSTREVTDERLVDAIKHVQVIAKHAGKPNPFADFDFIPELDYDPSAPLPATNPHVTVRKPTGPARDYIDPYMARTRIVPQRDVPDVVNGYYTPAEETRLRDERELAECRREEARQDGLKADVARRERLHRTGGRAWDNYLKGS